MDVNDYSYQQICYESVQAHVQFLLYLHTYEQILHPIVPPIEH